LESLDFDKGFDILWKSGGLTTGTSLDRQAIVLAP
jgi:hypothetical protein